MAEIRRTVASRTIEATRAACGEVTDEDKRAYEKAAMLDLSLKEPDEVSEAFVHPLFDASPLRRYVVAPSAEEHGWIMHTMLDELVELHQWGPHSHSHDDLVLLLEQALAKDEQARSIALD